ncbi:MAG TPA: hypothetical protein G4O11_11055 [Anaerolineae bacterium]|nr:hypothetical protein [Anaerolineae bacterium]
MKNNKDSIFQKWLWEPELLRIFVAAWILIPGALAVAFYPVLGTKASWILVFALMGFGAWIVYGIVGKRVQALRNSVPPDEGEPVDSLIVNGIIQSPGIALLKKDELLLIPIVGKRVAVPLADVKSVRETIWYNGSLLFFKKGFWLNIPGRRRLGVAVSNSSAASFRKRLGLEQETDGQDAGDDL